MQIMIKYPENCSSSDVQLFTTSSGRGTIEKVGFQALNGQPMISIEKKDGYLYVEIDETEVVSIEKRG